MGDKKHVVWLIVAFSIDFYLCIALLMLLFLLPWGLVVHWVRWRFISVWLSTTTADSALSSMSLFVLDDGAWCDSVCCDCVCCALLEFVTVYL